VLDDRESMGLLSLAMDRKKVEIDPGQKTKMVINPVSNESWAGE